MKMEDYKELTKIIGARVKDILASTDPDDYGFELVFDNGYVLEIYINFGVEEIPDKARAFAGWTIERAKDEPK